MNKIFFKTTAGKIILSCLVGALFPFWLFLKPAPAMSLDAIVTEVQSRYDTTRDFQARFMQETFRKSLNRVEREEGRVYFKNPKRMRWEYSRPPGKLLVIGPEKSWLYLPDDRVVYLQDTDKLFASRLAIKFMMGVGRLRDDFQVSAAAGLTDREGNYHLHLVPKEPGPEIEKLTLTVDRTNYAIIQFTLSDFAGNTTRIEFKNIVINTNIAERLFRFRIPEGVETVTLP